MTDTEILVYLCDVKTMTNVYQIGGKADGINFHGQRLDDMAIHISDREKFIKLAKRSVQGGKSFHWFCRIKDSAGMFRGFQTLNIPQGEDRILGFAWEISPQVGELMDSFHETTSDLFWKAQKPPVSQFRELSEAISLEGDTLKIHFRTEGYAKAFNRVSNQVVSVLGDEVLGVGRSGDRKAQVARN